MRLEAGRGREGETKLAVSRLEDELRRVSQTLAGLEDRARDLEAETLERREESDRLQKVVARSSEKSASADSERDQAGRGAGGTPRAPRRAWVPK